MTTFFMCVKREATADAEPGYGSYGYSCYGRSYIMEAIAVIADPTEDMKDMAMESKSNILKLAACMF